MNLENLTANGNPRSQRRFHSKFEWMFPTASLRKKANAFIAKAKSRISLKEVLEIVGTLMIFIWVLASILQVSDHAMPWSETYRAPLAFWNFFRWG